MPRENVNREYLKSACETDHKPLMRIVIIVGPKKTIVNLADAGWKPTFKPLESEWK